MTDTGNIATCLTLLPCAALFSGIGLFALRRSEPMWFWAGSTVRADEIADVRAYNRANGRMWLVWSLVWWLDALIALRSTAACLVLMMLACIVGIPALVLRYNAIYRKYKR